MGGTVRDAATLVPLEGFDVTLHIINPDSIAISATSDENGAYLITDAPTDNEIYVITSYGPGYANFYARVTDPGSGHLTFDVLLDSLVVFPPGEEDSSQVMGQVLTPVQGNLVPVPNAQLTWRSGITAYAGTTDSQGRYELHIPTGIYSVTVEASGYQPVTDSPISAELGSTSYSAVLEQSVTGVPRPGEPAAVELRSISPNPFQRTAHIEYALAEAGNVELALYDLMGRQVTSVVAAWKPSGPHSAELNAGGLPGGVYFCRLKVGNRVAMRRVALVP